MDYEISFLKALLLTVLIETLVLFLFSLFFSKELLNNKGLLLLVGIAPTLLTLPYLWFIFPMFLKTKGAYIVVSELSAVVVESIVIMGILRITYKKGLLISFICNLASYSIGVLIVGF